MAYQIGTAGGQTKASSGYTFQFIQKQSQQIADCLVKGKSLNYIFRSTPKRFRFYDNTLLHILYHNKFPGKKIFTSLFQKNKPQQVLRFLDNESFFKRRIENYFFTSHLAIFKSSINNFKLLKPLIRSIGQDPIA